MYITTQGYVVMYPLITSKLPGFDGYFADFTENNEIIRATKEQLEHGNSGVSESMELLRTDLVQKTVDVCGKVEVYAKLNNNVVLAKEVHYPESELNKARGTSLSDKAKMVYNKAMEHTTELEKYGVTPTMLTNLKVSIDKFSAAIPTMRIGLSNLKMSYDNLKVMFKKNDASLEKMDLLVEIVKNTNPDFYKGYKNNRRVILKGAGSLALMVKVINAHDGTDIKGAKATFMPKKEMGIMAEEVVSAKPIVKKTADKGGFQIKNMPDGTYTVTIEKIGYAPKTVTVNITGSEMAKLDVKLEKN
jgi:PEGA domain.